jgi:hypothetical protein
MKRCQERMALPLAAQGFTAMADALATARGSWVGWSWPTALVRNVRPVPKGAVILCRGSALRAAVESTRERHVLVDALR